MRHTSSPTRPNVIGRLIVALIALLSSVSAVAAPLIYVIPLRDEIGARTWRHTSEGLRLAREAGADMVVVHLNTYGGEVGAADSIRTALLHCTVPVVAFVDNNAASAGALIALACDTVFMRRDASMGAATVVNGADGAAMPDKYQSYMRGIMRATAERHGKVRGKDGTMQWRRDPRIAEAMVDTRIAIDGLIDSTRVLTFTAGEAEKWGYSDGCRETIDEVVKSLGYDDYRLMEFSPSWIDNVMGFFCSPAVQAVLIMIILGGIYMELQTPGMGFPTVAATVAAALYFLPLYFTGIVSSWIVLLFLVGLVLLLLEVFVIPGFGVCGIGGCVAMTAAILIGLFERFSFTAPVPGTFDSSVVWKSLGILLCGAAMAFFAVWGLMSRWCPKSLRRVSQLDKEQTIADGYIGVDTSLRRHVGATGTALTDLRPSGKITIGGETLDAVSTHGFIEAGTPVTVTSFANAQLYVAPQS